MGTVRISNFIIVPAFLLFSHGCKFKDKSPPPPLASLLPPQPGLPSVLGNIRIGQSLDGAVPKRKSWPYGEIDLLSFVLPGHLDVVSLPMPSDAEAQLSKLWGVEDYRSHADRLSWFRDDQDIRAVFHPPSIGYPTPSLSVGRYTPLVKLLGAGEDLGELQQLLGAKRAALESRYGERFKSKEASDSDYKLSVGATGDEEVEYLLFQPTEVEILGTRVLLQFDGDRVVAFEAFVTRIYFEKDGGGFEARFNKLLARSNELVNLDNGAKGYRFLAGDNLVTITRGQIDWRYRVEHAPPKPSLPEAPTKMSSPRE